MSTDNKRPPDNHAKDSSSSTKGPSKNKETVKASPDATPSALLNQQIKRVMDLDIGDQLSVVFIFGLTIAVLLAPSIVQRVKSKDDVNAVFDDFFSADDPIDDLTKLARSKWGRTMVSDDSDESEQGETTKNALEYMLSDVLKSKALQQAAQQFVIQTLQSEPVQEALKRLVKTLWQDLVNDPETIAEVIQLLNFAIQNPQVRESARQLVLDLVEEPDVKQSLVELLQRLGGDDVVQDATQALLTKSAHNALNDPEILDHSMEFATDVVGDDIVQRTAGEALRNTVGHAVRPATTIVLTAVGVGMLILGVVSIGYARSSEQEALLFETAARSLHVNATSGIMRLLTWPGRAFEHIFGITLGSVCVAPIQLVRDAFGVLSTRIAALPGEGTQLVVDGMGWIAGGLWAAAENLAHVLASSALYVLETAAAAFSDLVSRTSEKARSTSRQAGRATSEAVSKCCARFASMVATKLGLLLDYCTSSLSDASSRVSNLLEQILEAFRGPTTTKPVV